MHKWQAALVFYCTHINKPNQPFFELRFFFFLRHTDKASWGNLHDYKRILVESAIHALGRLSGLKFLSDCSFNSNNLKNYS